MRESLTCTAANPMPKGDEREWAHPSVVTTLVGPFNGPHCVRHHRCPHCGLEWDRPWDRWKGRYEREQP